MKTINYQKTLAYAVAILFTSKGNANFMIGKSMYQHIDTIYDKRSDREGFNTLEVVYNFKKMNYEVLNVSNDKIGNKEITIL